jgi:hypothetical protein
LKDNPASLIEIADVNFYFMNADVLDILAERAIAIDNNNWVQVQQIN